ncbi:MAG: phosphatase PAP2 family protein, partial [Xanthomonadaceae bacterium]|nr:phosphatase PAP2 family protein [Xanthomonadaceae bacterium]
HATISVALYGFLAYVLMRNTREWRQRVNYFFAAIVFILAIGLSRIILGVHYLSDVWSGYLVGTLWLIIGISLAEWFLATGKIHLQTTIRRSSRLISMGLAIVVVGYYVAFAIHFQPPENTPAVQAAECILGDVTGFLSTHELAYTRTILGARQQPLGFAIVAADTKILNAAFRASSWLPADEPSLQSWLKLVRSGMDYINAPLVPAFWNGQVNDFAFEKKVLVDNEKGILTARLWKTPYWSKKGKIFVGVTRMYAGMQWGFFHTIAPDVDAARDSLLKSFRKVGLITFEREAAFVKPIVGNYFTRGTFFSRGKFVVIGISSMDTKIVPQGRHQPGK